ncbi:carbohydrate-binding domain-containing protein [Lysinibacillus telephonicus]|uniref:Carbohydrate-binding domain-containing protein n=1 Tax=Lysinibacillus telephonicus TaxID=1714840 RepID=A0A3S0I405_9BACI|nr:carbohydrate-binding domain-containing protein [Lysinibacillus telephonicus]RTQ95780.1 carbohydrate-binding domain-containing protein [Lysinibacillus telephonicus]
MKKQKSKLFKVAAPLMCTGLLFGCSNNTEDVDSTSNPAVANAESLSTIGNQEVASVISEKVAYSDEDFYSEWDNATSIKLNGDSATYEGDGGVVIDGSTITIRTSGVYEISGKLNDGQIHVNAEDEETVQLILNGVEINSSTYAPIYIENAEKTIVSLEEGTKNVLTDGEKYVYENSDDDEPNAALFSKDNLTINGSGTLIVNGNYNNGIASKDELRITGGTIQIDAVDDGLMGRDLVAVKDGNITIKAGGDGIKSTNDKDSSKALIAIEGGKFDIESANDGIQAETSLLIADGEFAITSGGGSPETIETNENNRMAPPGGMPSSEMTPPAEADLNAAATSPETQTETETAAETEEVTGSTKGLKASVEVAIGGGSFTIDSLDDAVHSNNSITITGGDLKVATGDDGIHADTSILTKGGSINVTKSYEGIESKTITIADGEIHVNAVDDGINVGGGNDSSGRDFAATENTEENLLSINGGFVYVNATGDGLDSNGSISMTDGTVIVNGPTNNNNGSLDYDQNFEISGGLLIASGSSGMAMATSEESTQNTIMMTYPETQTAGTLLHLEDSEGNTVITFAPDKDYQSVVISSPLLTKDASYTLYSGGTATGSESNGLFSDGDYQGGTSVVDFTVSDTVTWLNETGVTEANTGHGGMGGPGGAGGNRGDMFSNLDEETRQKVQSIMEQERSGVITQEEAQAQMEELGVELPQRGEPQEQNKQ